MKAIDLGPPGARLGPLLLIPGNDLGAEFYAPLGEHLAARGFRARLLTLPGFHGTPPLTVPGFDAMLGALREEVANHLEARGTLVGHSLGGLMALLLAASFAERVGHLVLLEPAIIRSRWLARLAARKYRSDVVTADRERFVNWSGSFRRVHDPAHFPRAAIAHYLDVRRRTPQAVSAALLDDLRRLYPIPFERVRAPSLVVRGASSGLFARYGIARVARCLPQATLVTLPRAGHWLANEADDTLSEIVARFVSEARDAGAAGRPPDSRR